ncbi:hypothetical protein AB6A40_007614 [Gnathostoma spinigerum]|uniref:Uncharacterized protein n=1 Tax=Gnathostoma spinigerum TaxID=75299 RepID=A0ABD6EMZ0_9BILA
MELQRNTYLPYYGHKVVDKRLKELNEKLVHIQPGQPNPKQLPVKCQDGYDGTYQTREHTIVKRRTRARLPAILIFLRKCSKLSVLQSATASIGFLLIPLTNLLKR